MDFVCMEKKYNDIKKLVEKYEIKTCISSVYDYSDWLLKFVFQPPTWIFIYIIYSNITNYHLVSKKFTN